MDRVEQRVVLRAEHRQPDVLGTGELLVGPEAVAVPEFPRHFHAALRKCVGQHRQVEVCAVAPQLTVSAAHPVGQITQRIRQRLLALMKHCLRLDGLLKPPEQGVLLDASLVLRVGVNRDGGVEPRVIDLVRVEIEPDGPDTHDGRVSYGTQGFQIDHYVFHMSSRFFFSGLRSCV